MCIQREGAEEIGSGVPNKEKRQMKKVQVMGKREAMSPSRLMTEGRGGAALQWENVEVREVG